MSPGPLWKHRSFARRLHDALQGRGIRCWLDEHQVLPGHDILDEVDRGIRLWDKVLLCASEASLSRWWVDGEIIREFQKEQALMKDPGVKVRAVIPLNLDGYLFKWQSGKASELKARLAADFTGWELLDRLCRAPGHCDCSQASSDGYTARQAATAEAVPEPMPSA